MKSIYLMIFLIGLNACRKEEALTPSTERNNYFAPDPVATDEESVLRRNFFEVTDCYLLFSDTLRHDYQGLNAYGEPWYITETVGLEWFVTSTSFNRYHLEYLTTMEEKLRAAELGMSLLSMMKTIKPFSILLVNGIDIYNNGEYKSSLSLFSGKRCLAIDVSAALYMPDEEIEEYSYTTYATFILSSWGGDLSDFWYKDSKAVDFFRINRSAHNKNKRNYDISNGLGDEEIEKFYELGFLENTNEQKTPTEVEDAISFIKTCLRMSDVEFRAKYEGYDYIMQKYEIIRPLMDEFDVK